jgi:hypothetical protein
LQKERRCANSKDMTNKPVDFQKSLQELTGLVEENPEEAPTPLVERIWHSWQKPLSNLSDEEIGRLIIQQCGMPYILDLVWPKLQRDPLFNGGYYPGDVLSALIRSEKSIWNDRPEYKAEATSLYERALQRTDEENFSFLESLGIPANRGRSS